MALITDPDLLQDTATDDGTQEVFINTSARTIKLNLTGSLSTDGVTLSALYSFLKEQWTADPFSKLLAAYTFPFVPITDENFEMVDGWDFNNDATRYLIRTSGWTVSNVSASVVQKWSGIIGLGTLESNDQPYYSQGSGATNFQLTGQVNQAIQVLRDDDGDGNFSEGSDFSRRTVFKVYTREQGQVYDESSLASIGITQMDSFAYRFPLTTATDPKITHADNVVSSSAPYSQILVRYFNQPYSRAVDLTGSLRNFGIVIDVGTHSAPDGTISGSALTSSYGGISGSNYVSGTLTVFEGPNSGSYTVFGTPTSNIITIVGTFPTASVSSSFTLQRTSSVDASAEQIYEKVQFLLRQSTNINSVSGTITGKTADRLLTFVGDTLNVGTLNPSNSLGGGTGVIIEGFRTTDNNRLVFRDNAGTDRSYPFLSILTLQFGPNLVSDADAKFWVYFTTLSGSNNDFGEAGALLVRTNTSLPMSGAVSGSLSASFAFDYDGNTQGGRTPGTDAGITIVATGLSMSQYTNVSGSIQRSTTNVVSLRPDRERNYVS